MKGALPEINLDECTGCGDCLEWCPAAAVALVNGKAVVVRPEDCHYCTDCEVVCPTRAIKCPFEIILVRTQSNGDREEL
ncbi:MAG: 4Fe-4S dicluster domain-containing protein [Dehalococcoidales bacterium]